MNTEDTTYLENMEEGSILSAFFSQKTVEWLSVIEKFTPEMIKEVLEFEPKFSEYDLERVVSCAHSKECLYVVAGIISRIRSKQMVQFHIQKTRENVISLI